MNNKMSSSRWYGRIIGLLLKIAKKNAITFTSQDEASFMNLLRQVWEVTNEIEKDVINKMIEKWNAQKKIENEQHTYFSQHEINDLIMKGTEDVNLVLRDYDGYEKLLENTDFYAEEMQRLAELKKKKRKQDIMYIIGVFAVLLSIYAYNNLPFFKEWKLYNKVMEDRMIISCNEYYREYPDGRHCEDVMFLELGLTHKPFPVALKYLNKFPNGKFQKEFNDMYDALWDKEIEKYENRDKTNEDIQSVHYIKAMLQHMKKHRINTILLDIKPHIELKDYTEYDETVRSLMEILHTNKTLPLKKNMVSLKENFTEGDRNTLTMILAEGLKKSFENMFSPDVVTIITDTKNRNVNSPRMVFDYVIKNQQTKDLESNFPSIWTYTSNGVPKAYLLGIDVNFQAIFSIPNSDITYTYTEIGEPGNEISGIKDIKDGYKQMTQMCFAKFSNTMSKNLGLEQSY